MYFKNYIYKNKFNKKIMLVIILLILALLSCFSLSINTYADEDSSSEVEKELSQSINELLNDINLIDIENIVDDLDTLNLFEGSVKEKIKSILSGEFFNNYSSVFSAIISIFLVDFREFLPFLFTILAIGVLANLINEFKSSNDETGDIVHLVCLSVLIIVILFVFKDILSVTSTTLSLILKQMEIIFPILISLMSSIGSFTAISIYNPIVAVLTTVISIVFDKVLYPIFIVVFIFTILGNLTNTIKLDKFQGFLSTCFKWIVGMVFTLFAGFLSIQGITAGKFDSVSIKATKFAVKSYIPIIGSYISEGMDFLVLGSVLVKNTIGLVGILILFVTVISPIVSILVIKLCLQLSSAILEMCGNKKMSNFLSGSSKVLIMPIVIILGVSFMYIITVALIMCTANIF